MNPNHHVNYYNVHNHNEIDPFFLYPPPLNDNPFLATMNHHYQHPYAHPMMLQQPQPQPPASPINVNALHDAELEWAWQIKRALLARSSIAKQQQQKEGTARATNDSSNDSSNDNADNDDDELCILHPLSDYDIAQLAVVTLGQERHNLDSILESVLGLQCLREEYGLVDTPAEGVELIRNLITHVQPGLLLAFDKSPDKTSYMSIFDFARLQPAALEKNDDANWRAFQGSYYYMLQAGCCNLQYTREGFVSICECQGMSQQSFNTKMVQRVAQEVGMHYPKLQKESLWLNTPLVANVMYAFVKPWMKSRWDNVKLGCKLEWFDGRIDALINVPTPQLAQERLLINVHAALVERYHHVQHYVLPSLPNHHQYEDDDDASGDDGDSDEDDDENDQEMEG